MSPLSYSSTPSRPEAVLGESAVIRRGRLLKSMCDKALAANFNSSPHETLLETRANSEDRTATDSDLPLEITVDLELIGRAIMAPVRVISNPTPSGDADERPRAFAGEIVDDARRARAPMFRVQRQRSAARAPGTRSHKLWKRAGIRCGRYPFATPGPKQMTSVKIRFSGMQRMRNRSQHAESPNGTAPDPPSVSFFVVARRLFVCHSGAPGRRARSFGGTSVARSVFDRGHNSASRLPKQADSLLPESPIHPECRL